MATIFSNRPTLCWSHKFILKNISIYLRFYNFALSMPDGVIGNTSDSGSEESRFEPWSGNLTEIPNQLLYSFLGIFVFLLHTC